jgi:hypothetical protein
MAGCSMATSEGTEASECGEAGCGGDLVVSGAWSGAFRFRPGAIVGLVWGDGGAVERTPSSGSCDHNILK